MKKFVTILLLLGFALAMHGNNGLKLIKEIGDEREDYTFFILVGAVMSEDNEIFVLDGQGIFIAKYDWNGKFIKKSGQKGQGPKDLSYPRSLTYHDGRLTVLDMGNYRIASYNKDLEKVEYTKPDPNLIFDGTSFELKDRQYVGVFRNLQDSGRIGIVNSKGEIEKKFFNNFPIKVDTPAKKEVMQNVARRLMINIETIPILGVDNKRSKLLVSYRKPDNPIHFYVYSNDGNLLKQFSYQIEDSKYKINDYYITATIDDIRKKANYPEESFVPRIFSQFIYKNHYIVQLWLQNYKKKELVKRRSILLIFDEQGNLKKKIETPDNLRIFSISEKGYVFAGKLDEEVSKLYIYKLTI